MIDFWGKLYTIRFVLCDSHRMRFIVSKNLDRQTNLWSFCRTVLLFLEVQILICPWIKIHIIHVKDTITLKCFQIVRVLMSWIIKRSILFLIQYVHFQSTKVTSGVLFNKAMIHQIKKMFKVLLNGVMNLNN